MLIVITGANRGIGLSLAAQYKSRGNHVIAAVRKSSKELDATGAEVAADIDVTSDAAVNRLRQQIGDRKVDILISNAGALTSEHMDDMDFDRIRAQFEINTLGPLRVIHTLQDCLQQGAKVGILTSRVGSMTDNGYGGNYGYRLSKAAANMVGKNLSIDLAPKGVAVFLLHPGWCATKLVNYRGTTPPGEAASGIIERLDNLTIEQTGTFWHAEGYELPW